MSQCKNNHQKRFPYRPHCNSRVPVILRATLLFAFSTFQPPFLSFIFPVPLYILPAPQTCHIQIIRQCILDGFCLLPIKGRPCLRITFPKSESLTPQRDHLTMEEMQKGKRMKMDENCIHVDCKLSRFATHVFFSQNIHEVIGKRGCAILILKANDKNGKSMFGLCPSKGCNQRKTSCHCIQS